MRAASAALVWALALVFAAGATHSRGTSLTLTLVLLLGRRRCHALCLQDEVARIRPSDSARPRPLVGVAAGVLLGIALWHVAGEIGGDGLLPPRRVRKLAAWISSLDAVSEFPNGGLHPGYAFPLLHLVLALVAKVAGVDPADVDLHEPSVLAPLMVVAYEAGGRCFAPPRAGRERDRGRGGARRAGARTRGRARRARAAGDVLASGARSRRPGARVLRPCE